MMGIYTDISIQLVLAGMHHRLELSHSLVKNSSKIPFQDLTDSITPSSFSVIDTIDLKYRLHY